MTKIMLVEDDKSLREIYGVRLLAEGYEIISAGDGEEALAMAIKEKPDLILSDVMMPKISGFDMLDILRATPETKDIKVIMMTALSSEDQRTRGETLGADRYLVKSQVGIEDVVRTVHDILADAPATASPTIEKFGVPAQSATTTNTPVSVDSRPIVQPTEPPVQTPEPTSIPVTEELKTQPVVPPIEPPAASAPQPTTETVSEEPELAPQPAAATPPELTPTETLESTTPTETKLPQPTAPFSTAAPASLGDRIINPITPQEPKPDMATLISQELNDGSDTNPVPTTPPSPPQV